MVQRKHSSFSMTDKIPRERITPNPGRSVAFCSSQITWDCVFLFYTDPSKHRVLRRNIASTDKQVENSSCFFFFFFCPDGNISHCFLSGLKLTWNKRLNFTCTIWCISKSNRVFRENRMRRITKKKKKLTFLNIQCAKNKIKICRQCNKQTTLKKCNYKLLKTIKCNINNNADTWYQK